MIGSLTRVARVEARLVHRDWPWALENAEPIRAFWAEAVARHPKSFDGEVFVNCALEVSDGVCRTEYLPARYSAFLTWLRKGCPDKSMMNGFAMAALRGRDGAFVLGVMGGYTQNAGQIYFPAGTPDRHDLTADGSVDLEGSLVRELLEETHLTRDEIVIEPGWTLARAGQKIAFLRPVRLAMTGAEAQAAIRARLARDPDPELADIVLANGVRDIDETRMPDYLKVFLRDAFAD